MTSERNRFCGYVGDDEPNPFYFLKCEYEDTAGHRTANREISKATCTVRVFGKNGDGDTVAVELAHYQPDFFISFRNRDVCMRNLKRVREEMQRYAESLTRADDKSHTERRCHIKGIEIATDYSSLIIYKDHQDPRGSDDYGDTGLSFTYRVYVRCFGHIKPAIREILEIARDAAVESGDYAGVSDLERDVHFYESSLDANVLLAERLKLRACGWCWLDTSTCTKVSVTTTPGTRKTIHRLFYDFSKHVDTDVLRREGRVEFDKLPFSEPSNELLTKLPPPVSVLSFDIECLANDINAFPTPDVCGIIQIATVTAPDALNRDEYNREGAALHRCLYTVDDCDKFDEGTTVKCFDSEREMLAAFCSDLVAGDPDIITGYYIENFDFPFLFARLSVNGLAPVLGRLGLVSSCVEGERSREKKYSSYIPKSNFTTINGRTVFDACVFVRKEFSMRSYTLNSVSEHFLKSRKEDVNYTQIPALFNAGPHGRAVLGRYCVKDAQLVMDLVFHLQAFVTMFERCKVFNTTLGYMLDRGQQVRIISMLLKWCSARRTLINDCTTPRSVFYDGIESDMRERLYERHAVRTSRERGVLRRGAKKRRAVGGNETEEDEESDGADSEDENEGGDRGGKSKNTRYDGAVVIDPKRGLYYDPIVCLDYASLYPSIMIAYNLCYSTMILDTKHGHDALTNGTAVRSPVGHYFLTAECKKGALPSILETLISTRSDVRERMKGLNPVSMEYVLLDGQQGALKIAANSIYGATGSQTGKLYFLQIPSSVTSYGRSMIVDTKEFIEKTYSDRVVVYGDTDSVMIHMVGWTSVQKKHLWECTEAGNEMADSVTRLIGRTPIKLQFETVYLPFLLANKKRYAAGIYRSLDKVKCLAEKEGDEAAQAMLDAMERHTTCKGLEVVRRDNCVFAKNTLQKTVDMIMAMERPEEIVNALRRDILRLLRGEVNIRDLVISKEWTKKTKNPTPHDRLAQKMAERNPGEAPRFGERIQYIVIESRDGRTEKMCDRAEDPLYVLEHGLAIDYVYYANNQLLNPLTNVLAIAMPELPKEDIKDLLWPSSPLSEGASVPERPNGKRAKRYRRNTKHDIVPSNNKLITSFFVRPTRPGPSTTGIANPDERDDIEDVCSRLERECLVCKNGDDTAVVSCKNRDCSLLYERYTQKRRIRSVGYDVDGKSYAKVLGFA